jgi:transcriptional regulator with XRE-family HTH domain
MTFQEAMKLSREAQGLSYAELARLVGADQRYLSKIERGERTAARSMKRRIADALGDRTCRRLAYGWST